MTILNYYFCRYGIYFLATLNKTSCIIDWKV